MPQTRATKAIRHRTSALNASARRNPRRAVKGPESRNLDATRTASTATAAKAIKLDRSHEARERANRQNTLAASGKQMRRIKYKVIVSSFPSHDFGRLPQQIAHRQRQPQAE